jgi:predicted short-subunit dehydrogenase-like oxidoreductase (DUF2520 family)
MNKNLEIAIIGAGRLGTTIGFYITSKKIEKIKVVAITARTRQTLKRAKKTIGRHGGDIIFTLDNKKAVEKANCIFICTPDDLISKTCENIYRNIDNDKKERIVIHFSGSRSLKDIGAAAKNGDHVASIHPLKSFASIKHAIKTLENTEYGITYLDREGKEAAELLVNALSGGSIFVEDDKKPVYHAAACIASNYLVALMDYALYMNEKIGIRRENSIKGLLGLAEGTINNIKSFGTKKSLTGPIARGDTGTIEDHLKIFKGVMKKEDTVIYRVMGLRTAHMAKENGLIDEETFCNLKDILKSK